MAKITRTETRVLQALRLLDRVAVDEYADAPKDLFPNGQVPTRYLHGFAQIKSAADIVATSRKSSEIALSGALRKLVDRGAVEKHGDASRERPHYILSADADEKLS